MSPNSQRPTISGPPPMFSPLRQSATATPPAKAGDATILQAAASARNRLPRVSTRRTGWTSRSLNARRIPGRQQPLVLATRPRKQPARSSRALRKLRPSAVALSCCTSVAATVPSRSAGLRHDVDFWAISRTRLIFQSWVISKAVSQSVPQLVEEFLHHSANL